jgi:hypothetical protein
MKWIIIRDDLQIRLDDGKPTIWSRQAVMLAQVIDAVSVWLETHDNGEADAWLEQAVGKLKKADAALDLEKQITHYLYLDQMFEPDVAPEVARTWAID